MATDWPKSALDALRRSRWFGGLTADLQALILQRSVMRCYGKGEYIIRQGEPTRGMFAVLEGKVRVLRLIGDSKEVLIHLGEAGLWFGDYAMMAGSPSIGSIVADSRVRTLFLPVAEFERIVADEPRHYRAFAALLIERYEQLYRYMAEAQGLAPEERLRTRLTDLALLRRRDGDSSDPISVTVSQAELATMIGVSRQTLSALLARLEARGLIQIGFRDIRVLV